MACGCSGDLTPGTKQIVPLDGLGLTKKQREALVGELAEKLRLERAFARDLGGLFTRTARDFRNSYAVTGSKPDRSAQLRQFELVLNSHLRKVYDTFSNTFREQNKELFEELELKQEDDEEGIDELIAFALMVLREDVVSERASTLVDTNERQMDVALGQARMQLTEQGESTDSRSVAALAATFLSRLFRARVPTIARNETQEGAEAAKLVEAQVLAGRAPFPLQDRLAIPARPDVAPRVVTKTWVTVGDDRVRPTHVAANGTTIPESGIFVVGNSRLRFPTDRGLGASLEEILGCRCSALYRFSRTTAGVMFLRQRQLLLDTKEWREEMKRAA